MKKILTYALILTVVALVTISGTYALFTASTSTELNNAGAHQVQVRYTGDTQIEGFIELVKTKEEGFRRVIRIGKGEDSVPVTASIYMYLTEITEGFTSKALKWEIYKISDGEEIYINDGTFENAESGNKIYLNQDFELSNELTEYVIYIWLNGYEAGNEVIGASLLGYIGAESSVVTGDIN